MATVTVTLSLDEKALLGRIAGVQSRSEEELAAAALREYLKFEAEQIRKIQEGGAAADRGTSQRTKKSKPSSPDMPILNNAREMDSPGTAASAGDR